MSLSQSFQVAGGMTSSIFPQAEALLVALDMAYEIFSEQRRVSWNWYANKVRQKLAA